MNYREQFYEGEIDGKTLLDVIDEKEAEAQALREELKNECKIAAFWNEQAEKYKAEAESLRQVACLNGKAVSEGLLREVSRIPVDGEKLTPERFRAVIDLNRELLGEGKEHE